MGCASACLPATGAAQSAPSLQHHVLACSSCGEPANGGIGGLTCGTEHFFHDLLAVLTMEA